MKIKIYFFGKKGDRVPLEMEYAKRISFNHQLEIIPLSPAGTKDSETAKLKEADLLLSKLETQDFLVALDERGAVLSSPGFSDLLVSQQLDNARLVFVIGGAQGLHQKLLKRSNQLVSFGPMVWTKDLARLMLLEQLYRGFEIMKGSRFHKA